MKNKTDVQEIKEEAKLLLSDTKSNISDKNRLREISELITSLDEEDNIEVNLPTALWLLYKISENENTTLKINFEEYQNIEFSKGEDVIKDIYKDINSINNFKKEKEEEQKTHKKKMDRFSLGIIFSMPLLIILLIIPLITPFANFLEMDTTSNIIYRFSIIIPFVGLVYQLHERFKTYKCYYEREKEIHGMIDGKILLIQSLDTTVDDKRSAMKSISDIIIHTKKHWPQEKNLDPLSQSIDKFTALLNQLTKLLNNAEKKVQKKK